MGGQVVALAVVVMVGCLKVVACLVVGFRVVGVRVVASVAGFVKALACQGVVADLPRAAWVERLRVFAGQVGAVAYQWVVADLVEACLVAWAKHPAVVDLRAGA